MDHALPHGVSKLIALRLREDLGHTRAAPDDVPVDVREWLDAAGQELEPLGFEPLGFMREASALDDVDPPTWTKLYARPATPAFALLAGRDPGTRACELTFVSLAEDGRKLATGAFGRLPAWQGLRKHVAIDAGACSYTDQWQRHERELAAQEEFDARDASADELIAEWSDSARRATAQLLERGRLVRCGDGRLRLGRRAALEAALRSARVTPRVALVAAAVLIAAIALPFSLPSRRAAPPPEPAPAPAPAPTAAPLERARTHARLGAEALRQGRSAEALAQLETAAALLAPLDARALEARVQLDLGRLAGVWPEDVAEPERGSRVLRHLERALDLREAAFGPESLEVAEVLESFPARTDRAASLVRQLRLIAIYERQAATDGSHLPDLLRAYEAVSLLRADAGDDERAERALRRALDAATSSGEARSRAAAANALAAFYLARNRFAEARALEPIGLDRCWLMYWEGDFAAARACFDALGPPAQLDLALVEARGGDADAARRRLSDARELVDRGLLEPGPGSEADWAARERARRAEERARVLTPLL